MMRFIVQRAMWGVLVVMSVVTLVFFLIFVAGDPAVTILGPQARAEQIADFKAKKGLDRPVPEQFLSYLGRSEERRAGKECRSRLSPDP